MPEGRGKETLGNLCCRMKAAVRMLQGRGCKRDPKQQLRSEAPMIEIGLFHLLNLRLEKP